MTILPQKPRPPKDKPPGPAAPAQEGADQAIASQPDPNSFLNRPSTSRAFPPSSSSSVSSTSASSAAASDVVTLDRRLVKSLKRASATPPLVKKGAKKEHFNSSSSNSQEACNSEDEYELMDPSNEDTNPATLLEREIQFERLLKEKGYSLRRMAEDGGCLFRAVADQVYGDQRWHDVVRRQCVDHMEKNRDYYSAFVTEEFDAYLKRKRRPDCYGNNIEIQALSEIYGRPVEIYRYSTEPINIFQRPTPSSYPPLRLSYHNRSHYNSVVSPYEATVGVGLGLPGYQPGIADRNLMRDASLISENCEIEKAMLEDKLRETDWEKTQEALEKQVARESYVQWVREQEERLLHLGDTAATHSATSTSDFDIPSTSSQESTPVKQKSTSSSSLDRKKQQQPQQQTEPVVVTSCSNSAKKNGDENCNDSTQEQPISWEDWISDETSEKEIMLAVIARSQEDYINSFAKQRVQNTEPYNNTNPVDANNSNNNNQAASSSCSDNHNNNELGNNNNNKNDNN